MLLNPASAPESIYGRIVVKYTTFGSEHAAILSVVAVAGVYMLKNLVGVFAAVHEMNVFAKWKSQISNGLYLDCLEAPYKFHVLRGSADVSQLILVTVPYVLNQYIAQLFHLIGFSLLTLFLVGLVMVMVSKVLLAGIVLGIILLVTQSTFLRQRSRAIGKTFCKALGTIWHSKSVLHSL